MKKYLLLGFLWVISVIIVQAQNAPPVLNSVSGVTVDNSFTLLFTDDGTWQSLISEIRYGDDVVDPSAYDAGTTSGEIVFTPSASVYFQNDTTLNITIVTDGTYFDGVFSQTIGHGTATKFVITTQPTAPASNGGVLGTQPAVSLQDQYSNTCTSDGTSSVGVVASGASWVLGGTTPQTASSGVVTFSGLTGSSVVAVTGAAITFSLDGFSLISDPFDIPVNAYPTLSVPTDATVDSDFDITFTDDATWRTGISEIRYGTDVLPVGAYDKTSADAITIKPSQSGFLQVPDTKNLTIVSSGYSDAVESLEMKHGAATKFVITTQPTAPASNGGVLGTQPAVSLQDQYSNTCTSDGTSSVGVVASGASWVLGGTTPQTASSGVVTFSGLTGSSAVAVTGAAITFSLDGFSLISNPFDIPVNAYPTLSVPTDATVDSDFDITFTDDATWRTGISEIRYGTDVLPVGAYDKTSADAITIKPSQSGFLQTPGTKNLTIVSSGYADAVESLEMKHGVAANIVMITQPTAPASNGGVLGTQPVVKLQDQYGNDCTGDGATQVIAAADASGDWTLGGTGTTVSAVGGTVSFSGLTGSSNLVVSGAYLVFSSGSLPTLNSAPFDIPVNTPPTLTAATGATVDDVFEISYSDDSSWESSIDSIRFNGTTISASAYSINSTTNKIVFTPSADPSLQTAVSASLEIFVDSYSPASTTQNIGHGAATKIVVQTEPVPSGVNGSLFTMQPVVAIQDQYSNICTSNSTVSITAGENDPVNWTLGGTPMGTVASGVLNYTDLSASSDAAVTGAYISFTASGLTGVASATFDLGLNSPPVLTAASGVTVDGAFTVTFADENSWQSKISSISYGGTEIDASAYNKLTSGQIIFDPSLSTALQTAGTQDFVFIAAGFSNAALSQTIGHGVPTSIKVSVEPTAPTSNGGLLVQQPAVISQDQYLNSCTSDNATAISVVKGDAGNWSLGGSPNQTLVGGSFTYTDLSATSDAPVIGAYLTFSSAGFADVNSATFDIPVNDSPALSPANNATVDGEFQITFTDDATWRGSITDITFDGNSIPAATYDATNATRIIFKPVESNILQTAGTKEIIVISSGFANDTLSQVLEHGVADELFMFTQPVGPSGNGGQLATQPVVQLRDQYANICTTDNTSTISETTSGGTWTLGGTRGLTAGSGVFTYTDLTASSSVELTTASITFSSGVLTDVVSAAFTIPSLDSSPTLLASSTATVDAGFEISFGANATWQLAIDSIKYNGNLIAASAYDKTQSGKIIFDPALDSDLQISGTADMIVYALGYDNASVSQQIKHGVATDMVIVLQPTAPVENGALLANQPVLTLRDQYANDCTSENTIEITAAKGDANVWTLGGTLVKKVTNGSVSFTDLTASSNAAVTGAFIAFSTTGLATVNSNTFNIPDLSASPVLTAADAVTVDSDFDITFTDNTAWRSQITEIRYGTQVLPVGAYDTSTAGVITFKPAESPILQTVASEYIFIISTSFLKDSVLQTIGHGAATSIAIITQPQQPASNAGLLQTQPGVKIQDQYLNDCTTNSVQIINANATGGSWVVEGTTSLMVTNGIVDFTDLTARSTDLVFDATITFSGTGLTSQESETFIIPAPLIAPPLIASTTATVDSLFDVTFSENAAWQGEIDSISYGGNLLTTDVYDKSQAGKIVFDPSKSTELQVTGTKEVLVYSRGYQNAAVNQEIKHGIPDTIFIDRQPTAPLVNGGNLDTQPRVSLRDQYNNSCSSNSTFEISVENGDAQAWTLGGTLTQSVSSGVLTYSDLNASSETAIAGAFLKFSGAGVASVNSEPFDIVELLSPPNINSAFLVTVDSDFTLNFFAIDDAWKNSITTITYEGDTLPSSAYTIAAESITFHISQEVLLQKAGTFTIVIHSLGYINVIVEQEVGHGAIAGMEITQQPLAPLTNGDVLDQQPVLQFLDQYANVCTSEIQKSIAVEKNDSGEWTLAGTVEQTATNGIVTFTDLSAYSTAPVSGAELKFIAADLTAVVSAPFDIPDVSSSPVLSAAIGATVDNPFKVTFTEDSVWRSRINVVTVNDSVLSAASYNAGQAGELELIPSESEFLQKSGSFQIIVQSRGFAHDTVQQEINHGIADSLLITTQPSDPANNGELLSQQPVLKLSDQYLNDCTGDNFTQVNVVKYDQKAWILSGTLQAQSVSGVVSFTDLTATSEIAIDSAYLQFSFNKDTVISALFKIPVPVIELTAALNVTVDNEFTIQASDNASWRDSISAISFAGETLVDTSYLIEAGGITFYPDRDSILQIARTDTIVIVANGYANALVEQEIGHGIATEMVMIDQPIGPENNGDTLAQQPKLQLKDRYKNNCEKDNATQILASKYSDGSEADVVDLWDLGGTKTITAVGGLVTYLNLTATSENRVEGARLLFTSDALPNVVSDSFDIVIPPPPVIVGAVDANVDESFFVEFADNKTWRSLIFDIRYGIRSLEGNYDISEPGKITFDPTVTSILQKSGVDSMYIYSGNYDTVRFEQTIHHGKSKYLVIDKEPSAPLKNGDVLLRQPQLKLQDQFRNNCVTDNETPVTVKKGDDGDWSLAGTFTQIAVDGLVKFTNLTATSEREVEGARLVFEGTGIIPKLSQSFTIPEPQVNRAGEARANPELVCYGASSSITLVGFDGVIQWQKYDELNDIYEDVAGENSEIFISDEVVQNARYRAMVSKDGFTTQYSNSVSVSPIEPPLADFTFNIDYNRVDFTNLSVNATDIVWDFGDGIISSEFEPSHSFVLDNANGSGYVVSLTASNDACPDSKKSQQVFITTGIEDLIAETGVVVYPNPSRGEFFVELSNSDQNGILRIFDQAGKLVAARNIENGLRANRMAFDLKNLTGGIYFLTIQYPDKVVRTKLIIQ